MRVVVNVVAYLDSLVVARYARYATPTIDADWHLTGDGCAMNEAMLVAVVIHCIMLCSAIVPDRYITIPPTPTHSVFERSDMRLKQIEQLLAIVFRQANEVLHQSAEHERAFASLRVHAHNGMLSPIDCFSEDFVQVLLVELADAGKYCVVKGITVNGP